MGTETVRKLRNNPTEAERILWRHLRHEIIEGHRFRRQHPMGPCVLDFVCLEQKLVIEVDGGQHATDSLLDERRTFWLEKNGLRVIRFWNHEVLQNIEAVISVIRLSLNGSHETPHLSPSGLFGPSQTVPTGHRDPQGGRKTAPL